MTRQIRRVTVLVMVLFAALFANLNLIQVIRAEELANHPANRRLLIAEYEQRRGPIVVGEKSIARSVETDDELVYLRRYEPPARYAHLVGYYSILYGRDGLERTVNETLTGAPTEALAQNLTQLLNGDEPVGNAVRLTVDPTVQRAAKEALGDRTGAVVALDPQTGAVLAHVSSPAYDPNRLSSHDTTAMRDYWMALQDDPREPLADRAVERRYQPGSTFKLIVAAAALRAGLSPDTSFQDSASYTPPQTSNEIANYGGGTCAGGGSIALADALRVSCNVVFAELGVRLGAEAIIDQARRFGFNREPPYELPVAASNIPGELDPPATAQSAIGGRDVQTTALQMAMVAGAIANDGVLMRPHVVAEVLDPTGRQIRGSNAGPWVTEQFTAQAVSPETADTLSRLMVEVVESGTGTNAQLGGAVVGGKTGTADPGERLTPNVWFAGFAGDDLDSTEVAVAVVLPAAGQGATGGGDAAPIARAVMRAALPAD